MIVIKIELWPHGVKEHARDLGMIVIANDGTGTPEAGNYNCALANAGKYRHKAGAWKGARVTGYRRTLSPYHLIRMAIDACLKGQRTQEADRLIQVAEAGGAVPVVTESLAQLMERASQGEVH